MEIYVLLIFLLILFVLTKKELQSFIKYIDILKLNRQMKYNKTLFNTIDTMIQYEIIHKIKLSEVLGEKYQLGYFDEDVKEISNKVFSGLKKEIFINQYNIYTDEYIMRYITSQTTLFFLEYIKK